MRPLFCPPVLLSRRTSTSIGRNMKASQNEVLQYLGEAQASEQARVRVLQAAERQLANA
jgi:hypothetical protein